MSKFVELKTSYKIPELLQRDIDALREGVENNVSYIDCLQDEIRSSAHLVTDYGLTELHHSTQMATEPALHLPIKPQRPHKK